MSNEELEARRQAIAAELDAPDADLDALRTEAEAIRAELDARQAAAQEAETRKAEEQARREARDAVAHGAGKEIINFKGEKTMTNNEIRNTTEYINAFARYIKTERDTECRALLTENVNGTIPVPTFVEGIVAEEYRASRIMSRVRKAYAKGNVKVGFEYGAPLATFHTEGDDPVEEENLQLGVVTLQPQTLKKWVSMSDESLDSMSGEDYLRYIYSEVARNIVKAEEKAVVDAILAAPQTATATQPAVAKLTITNKGVADFINARALLTADASDLVIIMTPADYAAYKGLAIGAGFAFDPFEGIEVLFSDYATAPIIGDLKGIMANYPNGDDVQFKYDDRTLMTSDLVRVLGRKPVAIGVVGNLYFAKIST